MAGTARAPKPRYNAEHQLLRCAAEGVPCECKLTKSGKKPTIRAEVLRALMLGLYGEGSLAPGWVQIENARIAGALDLSRQKRRNGTDTPLPHLAAYGCFFEEPIDLSGARLDGLWLRCCELPRLDIPGAVIDGDLDLDGAKISGRAGWAIVGDATEITGNVFMRVRDGHHFAAEGEVRLLGAHVGGNLEAVGASLDGAGGRALSCNRALIGGSVFLEALASHRFTAVGQVGFLAARAFVT